MISRLRRKFIALGTAAVILIVFVVLAALNLASFYDEGSRIEAVLSYIARHDGKLPDKRIVDAGFDYTPEFAFQTICISRVQSITTTKTLPPSSRVTR